MPGAPGEDPQTMAQAQPTAPSRRGLTLTQQIFIGLALGIVAGALVEPYHPAWADLLPAVQPAVPAADQDDHRAADLRARSSPASPARATSRSSAAWGCAR